MSSNKKRKANIDSDEDSPSEVVKVADDVKPRKKSEPKKKIKKINYLSSDEEDGDTNTISINDIKKKAQTKAKNAIKGDDPKTPKASNKTPPAVQKNNLLNYFQKAAPNNKTNDEKKNEFTQIKQKEEKRGISDEFMTTTLSKDKKQKVESKPAPKVKSSSTKESSKELIKSETNSSKPSTSKVDSIETKKATNKSESKVTKSSKMEAPKPIKSVKKDASKPVEIKKAQVKAVEPKRASPKKEIEKAVEPKLGSPKEPVKEAKSKRESPKIPLPPSLPAIVEPKRVSDQWVDKYKPKSTNAVIGQQGDRSPMKKLLIWLRNWQKNIDKKPAYGKWGSEDGAGYRAALLSGPPGIGKTTTAVLACKELNYDYKELNASDVRNKKSLHEDVRELLGNRKLTNYFKTATDSKSTTASGASLTAKHVVIMDEVDGMSGNEDRGGVAELIQLIKKSKVPIICICNDRNDQKMRSLVNYCFDLRFQKPNIGQIRGSLMSIAFKENVNIRPEVLNDLIASSNFDIRQCIHNLSMLSAGHVSVKDMINKQDNYVKPIKDVKLGPFEAIKKVFSTGAEYSKMTFLDKSDLFFADYGIMPLFVYENYSAINMASKEPSNAKQLIRAAKAIDSISLGEIIEKDVRQNQNWGLLPTLAAFSTVMPGYCMRSENGLGMPGFPAYMGKLSTTNKNHRIVDELVSHMTLNITGTRTSFPLDYLEPMKNAIVKPMLIPEKAGVPTVLDLLESYSMTKDNMDSLLEISLWRDDADPMKQVDPQTKSALTRSYTKKNFALPYATANDTKLVSKPKGKGKGAAAATKGAKKGKKGSLVVMDEKEESESDDDVQIDEEDIPDFY